MNGFSRWKRAYLKTLDLEIASGAESREMKLPPQIRCEYCRIEFQPVRRRTEGVSATCSLKCRVALHRQKHRSKNPTQNKASAR
jgi:hypothetical protein